MSDPLKEKSYAFALRIVKLSEFLHTKKAEFVLLRKVFDSGVNVSMFIEEARQCENRSDFRQKYSLATKEAFKKNLLLRILNDSEYIGDALARSLLDDCEELQKMLVSALKTTRSD